MPAIDGLVAETYLLNIYFSCFVFLIAKIAMQR